MITAKDLDPPVKFGRQAHKLTKNWQQKWVLALRHDTHSVWYKQSLVHEYETRVLARTEANKDMPACTMQDLAEEDLIEAESLGYAALRHGDCLVLENGLTPETFYSVSLCQLDQQIERKQTDAQRKRVGMI